MAKLQNAFDSNQFDDMSNFDPVPQGDYAMQITNSDLVTTKDKKGKYIKFEMSIIQGEFKGRKIWTNLNVINANPIAVEIANKELATICRACGKAQVQDTVELHGIPMTVKVRIKAAKGDYPAQNITSGYAALGIQANPNKKKAAPKKAAAARKPVVEETEDPGWEE